MTSYISLLNKIEAFCNAHLQIKKYKGEFREQMPNFATTDEKYPVVFVVPTSDTETLELNQFTLDIYCVDIIQKDRANLNTIVSDCHLILKDLYIYFKEFMNTFEKAKKEKKPKTKEEQISLMIEILNGII